MHPPSLPARFRRVRATLHRLRHHLATTCPEAPALLEDPSLAERVDTTEHDHLIAAVIAAIDALLCALDDLE